MRIRNLIVVLAVFILGIPTVSYAQDRDRRERHENESRGPRDFHPRLRRAHEGIERGIRSGALTRDEARRLNGELDNLRDDEARMRADGRLTNREAERLERELDRLERHISALKHNDRRR